MNAEGFGWGLGFALVSSFLFAMVLVIFAAEGLSIFVAFSSGICLMAAFLSIGFFLDGVARAITDQARE